MPWGNARGCQEVMQFVHCPQDYILRVAPLSCYARMGCLFRGSRSPLRAILWSMVLPVFASAVKGGHGL